MVLDYSSTDTCSQCHHPDYPDLRRVKRIDPALQSTAAVATKLYDYTREYCCYLLYTAHGVLHVRYTQTAHTLENGTVISPDVKLGDKVLFGKHAGTETKIDGEDYLVLSGDDIMAVFE